MCGIAGWVSLNGKPPAYDMSAASIEMLKSIESRGKDATGIAVLSGDGKDVIAKTSAIPLTASKIVKSGAFRKMLSEATRACLLHTRQGTGGSPKERENNHPIIVGRTIVTHNGIISNHKEIKDSVKDKKIKIPEVDTWALVYLINRALEDGKSLTESIKSAIGEIRGTARCAVWSALQPNHVALFTEDGNSLAYGMTPDRSVLLYASEVGAVYAGADAILPELNGIFSQVLCAEADKGGITVNLLSGEIEKFDCGKMKPYEFPQWSGFQKKDASASVAVVGNAWNLRADGYAYWWDVESGQYYRFDEGLQKFVSRDEDRAAQMPKQSSLPFGGKPQKATILRGGQWVEVEEPESFKILNNYRDKICGSHRHKHSVIENARASLRAMCNGIKDLGDKYSPYFGMIERSDALSPGMNYYLLMKDGKLTDIWHAESGMFTNPFMCHGDAVAIVTSSRIAHPSLLCALGGSS